MTRRAHGPLPGLVIGLGFVVATSACATTYDTSATTVVEATTTVYVATGSTDDLLAAISAEVATLSEKLVASEGQGEALDRIEAQWAVVRPTVAGERPDLLDAFDAAIAMVQRSVERRRPADADKASKNFDTLVNAYGA